MRHPCGTLAARLRILPARAGIEAPESSSSRRRSMEYVSLGGLDVSRLGLGIMGMSAFYTGANADDAEPTRPIQRALDLGITLIDTAEAYGPYRNEDLVGQAISGRRDQVVLAT